MFEDLFEHLWGYVLSPQVALSHTVGGGLLWGLLSGGVSIQRVLLVAAAEELLCSLLWALIPDTVKGLGMIFTLYVAIKIYEKHTGPRVKVHAGAIFIGEKSEADVLQSVSPLVVFTQEAAQDGRVFLHTNLAYAEYWFSFWGGSSGKWAIDIADIHTADEGCERAIVKSLNNAGVEPTQCLCLAVGTDLSVTCAAEKPEVRDQWVEGFRRLLGNRTEKYKAEAIQRHFEQFRVQGEAETMGVNLDGMLGVLDKFGRLGDKPYVKELFNTFAKISNTKSLDGAHPILTKDTFGKFLELALKRPEIQQIYERLLYKKRSEVALTPQRLKEFLAEEQKEEVYIEQCKDWISQWEPIIPFNSFSSVGFTSFLMSDDQSVMDRKCKSVYQDMTQPLSHYFIATSHNTYLMKDQLKGKSSVDAYISAFKKGCKCVELDCWDGPNNEPIIYHGHTLTSKILFKDVIVAIRDYAFVTSQYPVILSFENHCSIEQQKVMASHLEKILGDMLYRKSIPEDETALSSPEDLCGYVIVKAKKLKDGVVDDFDEESDDESDSEDGDDKVGSDKKEKDGEKKDKEKDTEKDKDKPKDKEKDEKNGDVNGVDKSIDNKDQVNGQLNGDEDNKSLNVEDALDRRGSSMSITGKFSSLMKKDSFRKSKKEKLPKIAQELSDLVFYCQAVHFASFATSKEKSKHYEMSSFGEKKAMRYTKEDPTSFMEYNRRQLSRIYPGGSRVDSSNYDPQPLWNVGCQLVALNYQTPDKSMQSNQGLFADNGCCGYVLKPEFLRTDGSTFDQRGPFDGKKVRFLMIRIISGIQLPYTDEKKVRCDRSLQVQLTIKGVEADNQKEKTKVVKNNGYNPTWNDMIGFKIHVYELAMLTFTVKEGDTFLGQYTIPVRCLQQGYRRVPLLTKHSGNKPHSSLFVHIEMKNTN